MEKKVIFLDIDGVIQPATQDRFNHNLDRLKSDFEWRDAGYKSIDKYDIGAVYYDWNHKAVALLKDLCKRTKANFVISSAWRTSKTIDQLRLLFKIHKLDRFVEDAVPKYREKYKEKYQDCILSRAEEIKLYLEEHPEIDKFCVIDDAYSSELREAFGSNFVHCTDRYFNEKDYLKALRILGEDSGTSRRKGVVIVVSGASGAGKSSLCGCALRDVPLVMFSVSCTTRYPRNYEEEGEDYYFISEDEFKKKIENNEFLEFAKVYDHYYGTLRKEVIEKISAGMDVLLDIDVQGADQIRKIAANDEILKDSVEFIFVAPPDMKTLEERLKKRGTESPDELKLRLENAKEELKKIYLYDYIIVNEDFEEAKDNIISLIKAFRIYSKRISPRILKKFSSP